MSSCLVCCAIQYTLSNVGSGDMEVTTVSRTINDGSQAELVDQVNPNPLAPGESSVIEEKIPIDYCQESAVEVVKIYAEGNNPIGKVSRMVSYAFFLVSIRVIFISFSLTDD